MFTWFYLYQYYLSTTMPTTSAVPTIQVKNLCFLAYLFNSWLICFILKLQLFCYKVGGVVLPGSVAWGRNPEAYGFSLHVFQWTFFSCMRIFTLEQPEASNFWTILAFHNENWITSRIVSELSGQLLCKAWV